MTQLLGSSTTHAHVLISYSQKRDVTSPHVTREKNLLVRLVDILNGKDGEIPVVTEITQCYPGPSLEAQLVDGLLRYVEGDGDAEEGAVGKAVLLDYAIVILLGHESCVIDA